MIATRFMELRKRRGLMVALIVVTIGIPTLFLVIRLLAHAFAPEVLRAGRRVGHLQRPGGRRALCLRLHRGRHLGLHGRIGRPHRGDVPPSGGDRPVAVGALPGPDTGRTGHRGAAGGHRVHHRVRGVRVRRTHPGQLRRGQRAPRTVPGRPSSTGPPTTPNEVVCNFPFHGGPVNARRPSTTSSATVPCNGPGGGPGGGPWSTRVRADLTASAAADAGDDQGRGGTDRRPELSAYSKVFLSPSIGLMVRTGLWIELEVVVGFIVGLGLGSLLGQRTVAVILMIVLEIVLTPILSRANIPHLINLQRSVVGLAVAHLEPSGLGIRLRRGRWTRRQPGHLPAGAGVEDGGRLRHHRLAGGLDGPRCLADGEAGRLSVGRSAADGPRWHATWDLQPDARRR